MHNSKTNIHLKFIPKTLTLSSFAFCMCKILEIMQKIRIIDDIKNYIKIVNIH